MDYTALKEELYESVSKTAQANSGIIGIALNTVDDANSVYCSYTKDESLRFEVEDWNDGEYEPWIQLTNATAC